MSYKKKISVIVLGNGDSLKKALITNILGTDLSKLSKPRVLKDTEIYENDIFQFTCTPDLDRARENIKALFDITRPDMSLLVVEHGFSTRMVWQQVETLKKITGSYARKTKKEFIVVLPLISEHPDYYPFSSYTMERVFGELRQLAEVRNLMPSTKRSPDHLQSDASPHTMTGGRYSEELFTNPKKRKGMYTGTKVNLVLLGMSGTGKSASGNTILGKRQFMSRASSNPVTTECQEAETEIDGTRVRVIDTPDIFDDEIESSIKYKHVTKCKQLCQSGPCVYLLVMHVSRFTDGERNILKKLEKAFGSKVQEQTVILFTRGDELQHANMRFEKFLSSCQPDLKEIIEKCGYRCVVFENSASHSYQVEKLMQTVERLLETTGTVTVHESDQIHKVMGCGLLSCILI